VHQIRKYIFPNDVLLKPIFNRLFFISMKGWITSLKRAEIFSMFNDIEELILFAFPLIMVQDIKNDYGFQYLVAFLRKSYIFGEKKEQMYKRLEFDKEIKIANKKIKENLYSISNLELLD